MTRYSVGITALCHDLLHLSFFRISAFAFPLALWYGSDMLQAFVGIVSHGGIEIFCAEDPATVKFLARRLERTNRPAACFWSVLPAEAAALIEATLNLGQSADALELLLRLAHEYGLLLPSEQRPSGHDSPLKPGNAYPP